MHLLSLVYNSLYTSDIKYSEKDMNSGIRRLVKRYNFSYSIHKQRCNYVPPLNLEELKEEIAMLCSRGDNRFTALLSATLHRMR